jgi:medium-chain acyl-[acyl-carrier-protein] hydrolase
MPVPAELTWLFCLPHAGGSALAYRQWDARSPAHISVRPVELPGRGSRMRDPLADQFDQLVDVLAGQIGAEIGAEPDGARYVLFGHSFGDLLAFELSRTLRHRFGEPAALVVSGRDGPSVPSAGPALHDQPDAGLLDGLAAFGGTDQRVLADPGLQAVFLPVVRADLKLAEAYRRAPAPPLSCPVRVCSGQSDPVVSPAGLAAWRQETTGPVEFREFPGGHFYLDTDMFPAGLLTGIPGGQ